MNRPGYAGLVTTLVAALGACGETTATSPSQLNLDRPMNIAFGCFGAMRVTDGRTTGEVSDPIDIEAQPTAACDLRSQPRPAGAPVPVPPGQEDLTEMGGVPVGSPSWYGFILQQGPGTVALAQFPAVPATSFITDQSFVSVLDADPLTPGKNSISIGEDPVAIAIDASGCKVLTANAGSCDLSVLDIETAVDASPETPIDLRKIEVKNAAGEPIRSRPAAMVAEPSLQVFGKLCPVADGATSGASGLVYIAYPSCHLVAAVEASTGTMVAGIQLTEAGPTLVDGNVTCPDECGAGATITAGPRPVSIDLEQDPRTAQRRLVIGAENSSKITVVDLLEDTTLPDPAPEAVFEIELEDPFDDLGVLEVAMSPTIGMGGQIGSINDDTAVGGDFQFVYAIASDLTIRVADILDVRRECDTQIDPRYLRDLRSVRDLSCLPIGDPARPRRPGALGPGIELVGDGVPVSLDIFRSAELDAGGGAAEDPFTLVGYFAVVAASNGTTFIINIDDDDRRDLFTENRPLATPLPLMIAHQLRDTIDQRELLAEFDHDNNPVTPPLPRCDLLGPESDIILGGPRSTTSPQRSVPLGLFAPEKVDQLPGFRQLLCEGFVPSSTNENPTPVTRAVSELTFSAPESVRDVVFSDLRALAPEETWTLTWEGLISLDRPEVAVDGPPVRESQIVVDEQSMRVVDQSRPFCQAGVQPFDIVQLRGCNPGNGDADCPLGYRCFVHPNSQVQGLGACMLEDEADRLADACKDFLTSARRYTVATSASGRLDLLPRRHVLRTTPLEGCTSNEQCDALADYAAKNPSSLHPVDDTATDERTWACEADPLRPPVATGKRCLLKCDSNADCAGGTICQGGTPDSGTKAGYCMEGVVPPQACVNAPQRYEVRVGEAFAVIGERSGFDHATIADPSTGACVRDPGASHLIKGRIPISILGDPAQACAPDADPLTGQRPDGTFEPNPCWTTVDHTENVPVYEPGTCVETSLELRTRAAPAIRFRNRGMTMTIVDPVYPGDQTCILDRLGAPGVGSPNIPHVFTGYQLGFRQTAGFAPLLPPINPAFPVKVVRGPADSIWVIDEGDFLSTSIAQPSTRGQVFRLEVQAITEVTLLQ